MKQNLSWTGLPLLCLCCLLPAITRADNNSCYECHEESDFARDNGKEGELFVDSKVLLASRHAELDCTDCHQDAALAEGEHQADLATVNCAECHDDVNTKYMASLHGEALSAKDPDAPRCASCHGTHNILAATNPASPTYKINVPATCSTCHSEGKGLADRHHIDKRKVIETYSMSIHGEGVFQRGLTVAAVCNDCHGDHDVLPHENPASKIHRSNVANTCKRCHGAIEKVHLKVIDQKLWQEKVDQLPSCVDCHAPHKIRRKESQEVFTDNDCMTCHKTAQNRAPTKHGDDTIPSIEPEQLYHSAHQKQQCVMCHNNVTRSAQRPCVHVGKVNCSVCHAEVVKKHDSGIHGSLRNQGNKMAPDCVDCHGTHTIEKKSERSSPTNIRNIPALCGRCHARGQKAESIHEGSDRDVIESFRHSVHGKGLMESGLVVTAVCTECHSTHQPRPASDPTSTVHPDNLARTCANCHEGIFETFERSIHGSSNSTDLPLPNCEDCHSSHQIIRVDTTDFRNDILSRCGSCHEALTEAYFETYHGKVSLLGEERTAKCADCHSAHLILPIDNPDSALHRDNIVRTCAQCHPESHRQFAGYLTHATHKDPDRYPVLYYTFWFMTFLLIGSLSFFSLHTLLWLPRSLREMLKRRKTTHDPDEPYVRRFKGYHRLTHLFVIVSFFLLAITGMLLKFSYAPWAQTLSHWMGGFKVAGGIHRLGAVLTGVYFIMHIYHLFTSRRKAGKSWFKFIFGRESAFFNLYDLLEFGQTIRWFFGRGPRPSYGRFTYWEKFDYFAVFWGVAVIGLSGLMLWFPEFFTLFLPGWFINVATIVHSDEALLAAGFIFTIHFFNTHFRPERFPMDPVIFTGSIPLSEFKEERGREYKAAVEAGTLEDLFVPPPSHRLLMAARIFGLSMLTIGLTLVALIVYAVLMLYR
jgi:thiosulfate reductase cytochrome b subunit